MCIVALALNPLPGGTTIIAANRDEFHSRPTKGLHQWPLAPHIWGGVDLAAGGTWMAADESGRFAFVTNYRDPMAETTGSRSRGELVAGFVRGCGSAADYMLDVQSNAQSYSGFNLVVSDGRQVIYYSNRGPQPRALSPGLYVLSNHLLDSPWPKARRLRARLQAHLDTAQPGPYDPAELTRILRDTHRSPDADLPRTGLSLARERLLSSPFIISPEYGTRSSTVMTLSPGRLLGMAETRYGPDGEISGTTLLALHPES